MNRPESSEYADYYASYISKVPGSDVLGVLESQRLQMLQLFTGRRPTRRMLELIQWYLLGWASVEELTARLDRELARPASKKRL